MGTYLPQSPQRVRVGFRLQVSGFRSFAYSHLTTHTTYLHVISALSVISAVNKHNINSKREVI